VIPLDQRKCWQFFSDFANVCRCIPGYDSLEVFDSKNARLKVKVNMGFASRAFDLKVRLTEVNHPSGISFSGEGDDAEVTGVVGLSGDGKGGTRVSYTIRIKPLSALGTMAVEIFGPGFVKKQSEEFAKCVERRLVSGPESESAGP
jgi:carbon monoxide dehydrogenase subunit G